VLSAWIRKEKPYKAVGVKQQTVGSSVVPWQLLPDLSQKWDVEVKNRVMNINCKIVSTYSVQCNIFLMCHKSFTVK